MRLTTAAVTIWVAPRDTLRRLVETDGHRLVLALTALDGLFVVLLVAFLLGPDRVVSRNVTVALVVLLAVAPLGGIGWLFVRASVRWLATRALGGNATHAELRAAHAWSRLPALLLIPTFLVDLAGTWAVHHGAGGTPALFASDLAHWSHDYYPLRAVLLLSWTALLSLKTTAEASGFSVLRAILAELATLLALAGVALALLVAAIVLKGS